MKFLSLVIALALSQVTPSGYSDEMFRKALANDSTAPNYVLVTIRNGNTGVSRKICIQATFLLGAIHRELGLGYDAAGNEAAQKLLDLSNRTFTLTKPDALKNVAVTYSDEQLNKVRKILQSKTNQELINGYDLERLRNELSGDKPSWELSTAYRNAIAHVFLERGILCGQGDFTDKTYIDKF